MRICNLCGALFKNREFIDGKWRNFQRRKYCLKCSPFGSGNTKKLKQTQITIKKKKKKSDKCIKWQKKARKERKIKLIQIFGNSCPFCGYNKCYRSFDFHHVDPLEKETTMSLCGMLTKWETIIEELKKCILVCSNCHREIHANFISQEEVEKIYQKSLSEILNKLNKEITNDIKEIKSNFCIDCNFKIDGRSKRCAKCYKIDRLKNRPPREQLLQEVKETNYCAVGRKYGVSDNCIRKWLK